MTHQPDHDQVTRNIDFKSTRDFNKLMPNLMEMGYLDQDQQPIGAGIHLVPLLKEAVIAIETVFQVTLQAGPEGAHEVEPTHDVAETMKVFHNAVHKGIKDLSKSGFDNPQDLAFELIFPHMNWLFCTMYANWCAQISIINIAASMDEPLDPQILNDPISLLEIFMKYTRTTGAYWSSKIAERALSQLRSSDP